MIASDVPLYWWIIRACSCGVFLSNSEVAPPLFHAAARKMTNIHMLYLPVRHGCYYLLNVQSNPHTLMMVKLPN